MKEIKIPIPAGCSAQINQNNIVIKEIVVLKYEGIVDIYDDETPISIRTDYPKIKVKKEEIDKLDVRGWRIPTEEEAKCICKYQCTISDVSNWWRPNNFWISSENGNYFDASDEIVRGYAPRVEEHVVFVRSLEIQKENVLE